MQFAYIEVDFNHGKEMTLISATEYAILSPVENPKNGEYTIDDVLEMETTVFDDDNVKYRIAYGVLLPYNGENLSPKDAIEYIKKAEGYAHTYYDHKKGRFVLFGVDKVKFLTDKETGEPVLIKKGDRFWMLPCAMLLEVDKEFEFSSSRASSVASFLHFENNKPIDNLIGRRWVFAIYAEEKRLPKDTVVSPDNWEEFIDEKRIVSNAHKIK